MNQAFVWYQYHVIKLISPIPPSLISLSVRFQLFRVVASAVPYSVMVGVLSNPVTVAGRRIERFLSFLQVASVVVADGGEVVLEWPQDSSSWMLSEVQAFEDQFGLRKVSFDGCAIGLGAFVGCTL